MAAAALVLTQFGAAALMLGLAAWLVWLDIRSRAVRAFAVFLVLRAGIIIAIRASDIAGGSGDDALGRVAAYYDLALPFVLAYFLSLHPAPRGPLATRSGIIVLAALVLVLEMALALDPCMATCNYSGDKVRLGPLAPISGSTALIQSIGAFVLARAAVQEESSYRRSSLVLMSAGFLLASIIDAGVFIAALIADAPALFAAYEPGPLTWIYLALPVSAFVPSIGAVGVLARGGRRVEARRVALWGVASFGTGLAIGALPVVAAFPTGPSLLGLWRATLPILVGYALVRYRVFDLDARATWTLSRGTTGGIVLIVFVVVTEVAANYVSDRVGSYFGFAAAGLLILMIAPLQHFAEKLVKRTLGEATPVNEIPHDDRIDVFRQQASRVLRRGTLSPQDRRFLDDLREHLHITPDDGARIEQQCAVQFTHPTTQEVRS